MATPPPARTAPRRRLPPLAALALALMAAGLASAKTFTPPPDLTAAPRTPRLSTMRTSATGIANTWTAQPVKSAYDAYLKSMRKPPITLSSTSKQATFKANLATITARNANTKLRWTAAANFFTDMSATERARYLGGRRGRRTKSAVAAMLRNTTQSLAAIAAEAPPPVAAAAASAATLKANGLLDNVPEWSVALPLVKDQGSCGSCWAFATTSITEAGHYINTGEVLALSEKNLVDCNYPENNGCDGGTFDAAFTYVIANGQATADAYPYTAVRNTCPANRPFVASQLASYTPLTPGDEDGMVAALANGPIAVGVTADQAWFDYAGGIFSSSTCGGEINHAVVITGAGVDDETQTPYWLIRNSFGTDWGEGGYMRLQRGVGGNGMCNVAATPFQAVSADQPGVPPSPPQPVEGCQGPTTITVKATTSLADVARQYKTSISQIMLDNNLNWRTLLTDGQQLTINCPMGTWSPPYGVWANRNSGNAMSEIPTVLVCAPGSYAIKFYVKPSQWYNGAGNFTGSTWVGTITMMCSDGTEMTLDTQPNFEPGWADGATTLVTGFTNISLTTGGFAVDSLFGVGVVSGGEKGSFTCPTDMLVTGFSGGSATSIKWGGTDSVYPKGWVNNLQFLCQNPYGLGYIPTIKVRAMRAAAPRFPRLRSGLSCVAHLVAPGDTWLTIAAKYPKIGLNELMRSNPSIAGTTLPVGKRVFIPPCVDGVVYGTRTKSTKGSRNAAAAAAAAAAAPAEPIAAAVAAMAGKLIGQGSDAPVVVPAIAPDTWA